MRCAMRWIRTEVFPVPAPATTSMGPWTCAMASRWRSSGVKGGGFDCDLETAIAGSEYHSRSGVCLELGGLSSRIETGIGIKVRSNQDQGSGQECPLYTSICYLWGWRIEAMTAVAAMAAVSARRMVLPSEAGIHW